MENIEYDFKSIKEIAQALREGKEVDFTLDTPEDNLGPGWMPCEWYGAKNIEMFEGRSLVIGGYGSGIEWAESIYESDRTIEEVFIDFLNRKYNALPSLRKITEDYEIAVDTETFV